MRKIIISFLCTIVVMLSFNAMAQDSKFQFGIKAGGNFSNLAGDIEDIKGLIGFNAGIIFDIKFAQNFYMQTGLEFTTKGFKQKETNYVDELTATAYYLQLPLHYAYKFNISDNTKIGIFAGPYFAYGIGGKAKIKDGKNEESYDYFDEDTYKYDLGIGGGICIEVGKFNVTVGYDHGLLDVYKDNDIKTRNQNAYLSVGCKF